MSVSNITQSNFKAEVLDSKIPVLIDFYADWCGPCKMVAPVVAELAQELSGQAKVVKINVDQEQEIASSFGVMSIPTFVVVKDGNAANRSTGFAQKEQLKKLLGL